MYIEYKSGPGVPEHWGKSGSPFRCRHLCRTLKTDPNTRAPPGGSWRSKQTENESKKDPGSVHNRPSVRFVAKRLDSELDTLLTIPNALWASATSWLCAYWARRNTFAARAETLMRKTLDKIRFWTQDDADMRSNMSQKCKHKSLLRIPGDLRDAAGGLRVPRASLIDFGANIWIQIESLFEL